MSSSIGDRRSPWDPSKAELTEIIGDEPAYRGEQVWQGLYERGVPPDELSVLPAALRQRLSARLQPGLDLQAEQRTSDGKTVKQLWGLKGGASIETVLMHYDKRSTICISSQAGCAMACGFCATGQAGYERNLSVGEILEQVVAARLAANPRRLSNVVFMGMGEPFANYDRVLVALHRLIDDFGIGARKITVSTVGLIPQILRFADEGLQVGLAVSLHAANNELRSELVPINRRHGITELISAAKVFRAKTGRRISYEWAMMDGVNDRTSDAVELAKVATDSAAHVNLIPLNPTPGWPTKGTPLPQIRYFASELERRGVNVTVRANRGTDIDAACGQLRANQESTPVKLRRRK